MAVKKPQPKTQLVKVEGMNVSSSALERAKSKRAADAKDLAKDIAIPRINLKSIDSVVGAREMNVVIVGHFRNHAYFKNPKPIPGTRPSCLSIGGEEGHGDNGTGNGVHKCMSCAKYQFGSSPTGEGKACRTTKILFIHRLSPRSETTPVVEQMQVAPTAVAALSKYMKEKFIDEDLDYFSHVTTVRVVEDKSEDPIAWEWEQGEALDEESLAVAATLFEETDDFITALQARSENASVQIDAND